MGGHAKMDDLPSSVTDHEPGVQQVKSNRRDDDEIHRGDAVPVIAKESLPPLALIAVGISLREISRNGCEADRDSELLEFCSNLPSTQTVLIRESTNEGLHFG